MGSYQKTPEEERRIVRQNALGHAVEIVKILSKDADSSTFSPKGVLADVTGVAKEFEDWVMRPSTESKLAPITSAPTVVTKPGEGTKECPKCGEQIPTGYSKHFRCGWTSTMGEQS